MSKRILIWGGFILGLIGLLFLLAKFSTQTGKTSNTTLSTPVTDSDHAKGSATAKVTLVEYSDFQCPACGQMYPMIKQMAEKNSDLKIVYRHFPLQQIHKNAQLAAQAAEAAVLQNKFWEMHDMIFNTQSQWSNESNPEIFFVSLANSLGLDVEKFKTDMQSNETKKSIDEDYSSGVASGVQSTPTFFLNGIQIPNPQTIQNFENVIKNALNK